MCLPVDSVGGTKSLMTPEDGFPVAFSGILLVWRVEKHVIIEMYYLVDVTGLLAPEENQIMLSRNFSGIQLSYISPFKDEL